MKTRRRVKRTVREMPRRLTMRLSKGSNRNMVDGPGKASASAPRTNHCLRVVLSDGTSRGEKASPHRMADPVPSSHHSTACGRKDRRKGHRRQPENASSPQNRRTLEVSEAGAIFSTSVRVQEFLWGWAARGGSLLCSPYAPSRSCAFSFPL